jgi:hypothetical protein
VLLPAEQAGLNAWYSQQDSQEAEMLSGVSDTMSHPDLPTLRRKVYEAQVSLPLLANENQELAMQNNALRAQIAQLKALLA